MNDLAVSSNDHLPSREPTVVHVIPQVDVEASKALFRHANTRW